MADRFISTAGVAPTKIAAGQCLLNVAHQGLFNVLEPSKLQVRLRTALFDATPFISIGGGGLGLLPQYGSAAQNALDPHPCFSGSRTGVTFEGPFLKYTLAPGSRNYVGFDAIDVRGVNTTGSVDFYFDLVNNRNILLPFPGSVELICQYPGTWQYEFYLTRSKFAEKMGELGGMLAWARQSDDLSAGGVDIRDLHMHTQMRNSTALGADATLTMRLAPDAAGQSIRQFAKVPPGAHSFTYNDDSVTGAAPFPTVTITQEDAGGAKGNGPAGQPLSTAPSLVILPHHMAYMSRIGLHNTDQMTVTSGAAGANGFVQWHSSFE